jgi:asparagine synthetase B (glutamine-hydrolysing)
MSSDLRSILQSIIEPLPENVCVATSAGIDSQSVAMSALDCNKKVTIVSFTLADRQSKDFITARRLSRTLGLEFIPVFLPIEPLIVFSRVKDIIRTLTNEEPSYPGKIKKTTVECLFPWVDLFKALDKKNMRTLLTGIGADGHFALSKSAYIHNRDSLESFQDFRNKTFATPDYNQIITREIIAKKHKIDIVCPYFDSRVFDLYKNRDWYELNRPRQKETVRQEFPELEGIADNKHTNLHMGDSGIALLVGEVTKEMVTPGKKTPIGAYNILEKLGRSGEL